MNSVEKLRKFFKGLDEQEKRDIWEIMTALRGPDSGTSRLKDATTARLRWAVFGEYLTGCAASVNDTDNDLFTYSEVARDGGTHFFAHYEYAIEVLKRLRIPFIGYRNESP